MKKKAVALLSGGLDSVLSIKLMLEQGVEVVAFHFTSYFAGSKEKIRRPMAIKAAEELGVDIIVKHYGMEYIDVVRSPRYGYGKHINPCIDCKIFMLKKAGEIMEEVGAGFIVTGEVLGQRPMSQKRNTMNLIEKASGLKGLILRPLSAKYFPPTLPEIEGVVERERLLDISGRSRAIQYRLASEFKLSAFGSPAGGCLLTDPIYAIKLKNLFERDQGFTERDIELLSIGRHFWLNTSTKLILGRNQRENEMLESLWIAPYALLYPFGFRGPVGIVKGILDGVNLRLAANLIGYYGKQEGPYISVIEVKKGESILHTVERIMDVEPEKMITGEDK
ncbi:MAG: hypothetical protein N2745_10510 [Syntrophorhabdaceae bacterium]|nr:hypothetical protein [Syntrophorhabdaceae bacterium]